MLTFVKIKIFAYSYHIFYIRCVIYGLKNNIFFLYVCFSMLFILNPSFSFPKREIMEPGPARAKANWLRLFSRVRLQLQEVQTAVLQFSITMFACLPASLKSVLLFVNPISYVLYSKTIVPL